MKVIIYQNKSGGISVVVPTGEVLLEELPARLGLAEYEIVESSTLPSDRVFRNAWVKTGNTVVEDLTKSKELGHEMRREKRAKSKELGHEMRREKRAAEFKPYDDLISKQIPGTDTDNAELARVAIRAKYATMQDSINSATTINEIKTALEGGAA
jgi:hypothetical protein